jgi:CheY-like chemotaxis protein
VDLHNQRIDPVALARELKADEELRDIRLLGFFSHVQTELQRSALSAGFDQVIPRSVFARDLPEILTAD